MFSLVVATKKKRTFTQNKKTTNLNSHIQIGNVFPPHEIPEREAIEVIVVSQWDHLRIQDSNITLLAWSTGFQVNILPCNDDSKIIR